MRQQFRFLLAGLLLFAASAGLAQDKKLNVFTFSPIPPPKDKDGKPLKLKLADTVAADDSGPDDAAGLLTPLPYQADIAAADLQGERRIAVGVAIGHEEDYRRDL